MDVHANGAAAAYPDLFAEDTSRQAATPTMSSAASVTRVCPLTAARAPVGRAPSVEDERTGAAAEPQGTFGFTAWWRRYLQAVEEAGKQVATVAQESRALLGTGVSVGEVPSARALMSETRERLRSALLGRAAREFAPDGGSLEIDVRDYSDLLPEGWIDAEHEQWDPDALWSALEQTYGGDAGKNMGLTQTAERLVSAFGLKSNPPTRKKNHLELSQRISLDSFSSRPEMSYHSREWVLKGVKGLVEFARWAGAYPTAAALEKTTSGVLRYGAVLVSRAREDFGLISLTTFQARVVFELRDELADQFQVFIATYGREALEKC